MLPLSIGILLAAVAAGASQRAEDWSRFRGPNGSGAAVDRGYSTEIGSSSNVVWRRAVRPWKSSPVRTRDPIFLTAEEAGELFVPGLDRRSGKTIRERWITRSRSEMQHPRNGAAAPSAVTDGENVFAFFQDFGLLSYDSGRGIAAERLARIFDPGFRAVDGRVSTGNWSLFTSRQLIQDTGGDIRIQRTEGKGTTVSLTLPCVS